MPADRLGSRRQQPTAAESAFAEALDALVPCFDYWLHEDADGTPWLLVSLDFTEGNVVHDTLRLDFDATGVSGGWSPAFLNWDDGVRCALAGISTAAPDGIDITSTQTSPAGLPQLAAAWLSITAPAGAPATGAPAGTAALMKESLADYGYRQHPVVASRVTSGPPGTAAPRHPAPPAHPAPSLRSASDRSEANRTLKAGNQRGVSRTYRTYCRPPTGTASATCRPGTRNPCVQHEPESHTSS